MVGGRTLMRSPILLHYESATLRGHVHQGWGFLGGEYENRTTRTLLPTSRPTFPKSGELSRESRSKTRSNPTWSKRVDARCTTATPHGKRGIQCSDINKEIRLFFYIWLIMCTYIANMVNVVISYDQLAINNG